MMNSENPQERPTPSNNSANINKPDTPEVVLSHTITELFDNLSSESHYRILIEFISRYGEANAINGIIRALHRASFNALDAGNLKDSLELVLQANAMQTFLDDYVKRFNIEKAPNKG